MLKYCATLISERISRKLIYRIRIKLRISCFKYKLWQDLPGAVSVEELARYLDLKELDERLYMFEAVSAYDG